MSTSTQPVAPAIYEFICECGDWVSDHKEYTGACIVCFGVRAYGPKCKRFRVAGKELRKLPLLEAPRG